MITNTRNTARLLALIICLTVSGCSINAGAAYVNRKEFPPEFGGLKLNQEQTDLHKEQLIKTGGPSGNIQVGVYGDGPSNMLLITWIDKDLTPDQIQADLKQSAGKGGGQIHSVGHGYCLDITSEQQQAGTQCELAVAGTASVMAIPGGDDKTMQLTTQVSALW